MTDRVITPYTAAIDWVIDFASPSTLASIIQDINGRDEGRINYSHRELQETCREALIANVGEQEAAAMIGDDGIPDDDDCPIECPLCRKATTTLDAAPEQGWTPYYWVGREIEVDDPVCPDCAKSRLTTIDGEPCLNGTAAFEKFPF